METYLSAFTRAAQEGKDYEGMSAWLVQIIVDDILLERKQLEAKIRAECAERAIEYCKKWAEFPIGNHGLGALRAAIMAEPKEATK